MIRIFATASAFALACAAPAIAQDTATSTPVPATQPDTTTEAPADLGPETPAPATDPAAPADPMATTTPAPVASATQPAPATEATPPAAAPAPAAQPAPATATPPADYKAQVAAVVDTEFPSYDGDKDGNLTQPEFGKWLLALRAAAGQSQPALDEAGKTKWVNEAFAQADVDKSKKISKAEMNTFLAG